MNSIGFGCAISLHEPTEKYVEVLHVWSSTRFNKNGRIWSVRHDRDFRKTAALPQKGLVAGD